MCLDFGYHLAPNPADLTRTQINFLISALNNRVERRAVARAEMAGVTKFTFIDDEISPEDEQAAE